MKHIYIIYTLTPWKLQPERYEGDFFQTTLDKNQHCLRSSVFNLGLFSLQGLKNKTHFRNI